jgi:hypothetical protein
LPEPLNDWQWIDLQKRVQHECAVIDHTSPGALLQEGVSARAGRRRKLLLSPCHGLPLRTVSGGDAVAALPRTAPTTKQGRSELRRSNHRNCRRWRRLHPTQRCENPRRVCCRYTARWNAWYHRAARQTRREPRFLRHPLLRA